MESKRTNSELTISGLQALVNGIHLTAVLTDEDCKPDGYLLPYIELKPEHLAGFKFRANARYEIVIREVEQ